MTTTEVGTWYSRPPVPAFSSVLLASVPIDITSGMYERKKGVLRIEVLNSRPLLLLSSYVESVEV